MARQSSNGDVEPVRLKSMLGKISSDIERIGRIIKSVRSMARETRIDNREKSSLKAILQDSVELCSERLPRFGIQLLLENQESEDWDISLICNPTQIMQVVVNLLTNAQDAVEHLAERWVKLSVRKDGHMIEISFEDSGRGIPASLREQIMKPFFTTKSSGKGTGLGLSISKSILEKHRGFLFIDEKCPRTRFVIRLPLEEVSEKSELLRQIIQN